VSGRRLWGLFAEHYPKAEDFFADHFVSNFCPLVWMKDTGANLTPDKLPAESMTPVNEACQAHLRTVIEVTQPEFLIGVGAYAEKQLTIAAEAIDYTATFGRILHPSPASPAANRDFAGTARKQLHALGVW
jgi:single-strand selective monofunctional uracil DNA glycosylase